MNIKEQIEQINELVLDSDGIIVIALTNMPDGENVDSKVYSTTNISKEQCDYIFNQITHQRNSENFVNHFNQKEPCQP